MIWEFYEKQLAWLAGICVCVLLVDRYVNRDTGAKTSRRRSEPKDLEEEREAKKALGSSGPSTRLVGGGNLLGDLPGGGERVNGDDSQARKIR